MTTYQQSLSGEGGAKKPSWDDAPAPAQVARMAIRGLFGRDVPAERIPLLTNAVHWSYGTAWGAVFGLVRRGNPLVSGLLFGAGVWALSYVQLVPLGIYQPPWEYEPKELAKDLSYHLVYGAGVAAAYEALD